MDPYASAGVDEEREQDVFAKVMRPWLAKTAVRSPLVTSEDRTAVRASHGRIARAKTSCSRSSSTPALA